MVWRKCTKDLGCCYSLAAKGKELILVVFGMEKPSDSMPIQEG